MDINIDLRDCIKFDNTYHFKLIRDGKIIQEETTHNIVCKAFFSDSRWIPKDLFLGNGEGTPSYDDSNLFNVIWKGAKFGPESESFDSNVSDDGKEAYAAKIAKYVIPASSEYVGTITECGIASSAYPSGSEWGLNDLCTHALIYDAEGNPISIEKTDLDILEIEIVFKIIVKENNIVKLLPWEHNPLHHIFYDKNESVKFQEVMKPRISAMLSSTLTKTGGIYCNIVNSYYYGYYMKNYTDIKIKNTNATFNPDTKIMTIPSCRLGTTFGEDEQLFIKGLTICNAFYIPFPNNSIFPTYTIENIDVGIGDGEQSIFTCPLGYFVNRSEQIKIDGVLQQEGIDYIIEENSLGCSNLMASNEAVITGGVSTNNASSYPLFLSCKDLATSTRSGDKNVGNIPYGFYSEKPLFFDCLKPTRVNYFQMGKALNSSGNFSFFGRNSEEEDWNEIISFNHNASETSSLTFEEVNYRYYKVSTDKSSTVCYGKTNYTPPERQDEPSCYFKNEDLCMFGYKGRGIIFTNPPAAGSVITMSADTDLPMKNNNFVLDFAITLQF